MFSEGSFALPTATSYWREVEYEIVWWRDFLWSVYLGCSHCRSQRQGVIFISGRNRERHGFYDSTETKECIDEALLYLKSKWRLFILYCRINNPHQCDVSNHIHLDNLLDPVVFKLGECAWRIAEDGCRRWGSQRSGGTECGWIAVVAAAEFPRLAKTWPRPQALVRLLRVPWSTVGSGKA